MALRSRCGSEADDRPIQYSEIQAYQSMTSQPIPAWEVELICRLDTVFRTTAKAKPLPDPAQGDAEFERFFKNAKEV